MALDPVSIKPVNVSLVKSTTLDIVALQIFYHAVMAFLNKPSLNSSALAPWNIAVYE